MVKILSRLKNESIDDFIDRLGKLIINIQYCREIYDENGKYVNNLSKEFNCVKYTYFDDVYFTKYIHIYTTKSIDSAIWHEEIEKKISKLDKHASIYIPCDDGYYATDINTSIWKLVKPDKIHKFKQFHIITDDILDGQSCIIADADNIVKYDDNLNIINNKLTTNFNFPQWHQLKFDNCRVFDFNIKIQDYIGLCAELYDVKYHVIPKKIKYKDFIPLNKLNIRIYKATSTKYKAIFKKKNLNPNIIDDTDICSICKNILFDFFYCVKINGGYKLFCKLCIEKRKNTEIYISRIDRTIDDVIDLQKPKSSIHINLISIYKYILKRIYKDFPKIIYDKITVIPMYDILLVQDIYINEVYDYIEEYNPRMIVTIKLKYVVKYI